MSENNKPSIRFKGFTEAWEQRKLGDTNTYFTDGNYGEAYPKASDITDSGSGVPFLTGGNLKNGKLDLKGANYITLEKHMKLTSGHLLEDDIVIAVRGSLGSLGYVDKGNSGWNINSQLAILRTDKSVMNGKFLIQFLLSDIGQKELLSKQTGSALKQLPIGSIKDIFVPLTSTEEQDKIGIYFHYLDHLITLHQRKYEKLVNVKKSMLEKMFPRDGKNVPEIRFSGFTEAWEQRKLGEVTESYSGGTPTAGKKEYYDGDIPFIRSGEISSDKTELFISEEGLNSSSAKMVKTGDILYALYGATSGEVSISKLKGAINQAILAIQPHQNYDSQFLMQWLRKSKENIIGTYLQGGQGNLSGNIVKELVIDVPRYEEQTEIGAYLKNLDNLITLHQREVEKLQNIKKSCLEKMFV